MLSKALMAAMVSALLAPVVSAAPTIAEEVPANLAKRDSGECRISLGWDDNGKQYSNTQFDVKIYNEQDSPGLCGGLWDNLKRFPGCSVAGGQKCEESEDAEGKHTYWTFLASNFCNGGMVESTIWEATYPNLGGVSCLRQ